MSGLYYVFISFIFGLIVGSFLNCVIYRLEKKESFFKGRSYCPDCHHQLFWPDLIPVFSFLFLRGKCRYCQKPISWHYPLLELTTGIIFALIFYQFLAVSYASVIFLWLISSFLIIIFVYDLKHYIIPDGVIYPATIIAFLYQSFVASGFSRWGLTENSHALLSSLYSALGVALFFLLIVFVSRGKWMGIGDVKLAAFMGLLLFWPKVLLALFIAFFTGAIMGTGLIILKKKTLKSEIPFGPFLILGTFITLFLGEKIINWYLGFLNL